MRRHDPDRFLCALLAPPRHRDSLLLLYAFNHELARARETTSQPMLALIRLQWWREVVLGAPPRAHEVAAPLAAALAAGRLPVALMEEMLAGREVEVEPAIATISAFESYLESTAGALAAASGWVLGADPAMCGRLRALGMAYGAAGVLRSLPVLARRGRCLLPADVLARHGLSPELVIARPDAPGLAPVRQEIVKLARARLRQGAGVYPRSVIAAALPGVLAGRDLARLAGARFPSVDWQDGRPFGDRLRVLLAALSRRVF